MRFEMNTSQIRLFLGISIFWIPLALIFDGLSVLVLPYRLTGLLGGTYRATVLGLLTFTGFLLGMLIQPIAGLASDRLRQKRGRISFIAAGALLMLLSIFLFSLSQSLVAIIIAYVSILIGANVSQAAQQGFIPDLVPTTLRGKAAGFREFADLGGAFLGFLIIGELLAAGRFDSALVLISAVVIVSLLLIIALVRETPQGNPTFADKLTVLTVFRIDRHQHGSFLRLVLSRFFFLLGVYAIGRFFLYFIADRLGLGSGAAALQAGSILAAVTLVSVLASPFAGWMADRFGRIRPMMVGSGLSAIGAALLITARTNFSILLFGGIMSVGSAVFATANWASLTELVPRSEAARFLGLANIGKAGAAAAAGLFGPLIDWVNTVTPGNGYSALFVCSTIVFLTSALILKRPNGGRRIETRAMK